MSDSSPDDVPLSEEEDSGILEGLDLKELMTHGLEPSSSEGNELSDFPEIPGYELIELLGQGGMGSVFLAEQVSLGRKVAVKVLSFSGGQKELFLERLEREAQTMAKLTHPNLVAVYDFVRLEDGTSAIVMERVSGGNVREFFLKNGEEQLSVEVAVKIAIQVGSALKAAHANGIIHRDIKPENLLLDENEDVHVTDFGLALFNDFEGERLTVSGTSAGTLGYMAPEQLEAADVDFRTDLYSLGVVLYELLTGAKPMGNFRSPAELRDDVPEWLDSTILSALEPDPKRRIESAEVFVKRLENREPTPLSPARKPRPRWAKPLILTLFALFAVGILWSNPYWNRDSEEPYAAELLGQGTAGIIRGRWEKRENGYQSGHAIELLGVSREPIVGKTVKIRLSFVRLDGSRAISVFFRHRKGWSSVELGTWDAELGGVGLVDGLTLQEQSDAFRLEIKNGERHELEVRINDKVIEIKVDGTLKHRLELHDSELGVPYPWAWDTKTVEDFSVVIGSFQSPTWFQTLSIEEEK